MMAVEELRVKEGAQVMLIKNLGEGACVSGSGSLAVGGGLVNGSVGVVLGFWRAGDVWGDFGSGDSKNTCGAIRNVKIGADAKTPLIRPKKVGDGEDKENVGLGKTVANDKGKDKPKDITGELFPLVRFPTALGSETVLLMREEFRIEDNEGRVLARRMQVSFCSSRFETCQCGYRGTHLFYHCITS
jgi:ATP-dependent DNA helicase PIF1